ncbi:MAG: lipoyl(octanoyl) transferase LipB [Saprospiraceae bacterium]
MEKVIFKDLGKIDYQTAWTFQQDLLAELIETKRYNRSLGEMDATRKVQQHYLLFCEHPAVYTLGRRTNPENLLLDEAGLAARGVQAHKINRGGDITFHGEGQVVGYPIFDLDHFFTDIHKYVRFLEEIIIRTLAEYGLAAQRIEGYTGVWLEDSTAVVPLKKICAIGVHLSRWVTMHGFALNVNTDLSHFNYIVPCGIQEADKTVTSLEKELGRSVDLMEVKQKLKRHFADCFEFEFTV